MQEKKKKVILTARQKLMADSDYIEVAQREGVELEKGSVLTQKYLEEHEQDIIKWAEFFTAYPDCYLDIIKPIDSEFDLFFYQRLTLRALMRYRDVFITAPRAFSKSFLKR